MREEEVKWRLLRISYATSMANIEKGLERIDRFVRGLKK
jgi:hypothetical protein